MTFSAPRNAAGQYAQMNAYTGVAGATPHRLVQMLMEGALNRIATAKGFMARGDVAAKGAQITSAAAILNGLRNSLDLQQGGEIAGNLDALYDYMVRRLMEGHRANDNIALDEVAGLLRQVKEGWDAIPAEFHHHGTALASALEDGGR